MNQYKKSELLKVEPVTSAKSKPCAHCGQTVTRSQKPYVVKFYSKAPAYVHHHCKDAFIQTLRTY